MSKKLALSLLLIMLGLATWDAVLDHEEWPLDSAITEEEEAQVRAALDGTGALPPK